MAIVGNKDAPTQPSYVIDLQWVEGTLAAMDRDTRKEALSAIHRLAFEVKSQFMCCSEDTAYCNTILQGRFAVTFEASERRFIVHVIAVQEAPLTEKSGAFVIRRHGFNRLIRIIGTAEGARHLSRVISGNERGSPVRAGHGHVRPDPMASSLQGAIGMSMRPGRCDGSKLNADQAIVGPGGTILSFILRTSPHAGLLSVGVLISWSFWLASAGAGNPAINYTARCKSRLGSMDSGIPRLGRSHVFHDAVNQSRAGMNVRPVERVAERMAGTEGKRNNGKLDARQAMAYDLEACRESMLVYPIQGERYMFEVGAITFDDEAPTYMHPADSRYWTEGEAGKSMRPLTSCVRENFIHDHAKDATVASVMGEGACVPTPPEPRPSAAVDLATILADSASMFQKLRGAGVHPTGERGTSASRQAAPGICREDARAVDRRPALPLTSTTGWTPLQQGLHVRA